MNKYGELIRKARELENQETSEPESQVVGKPENQETSKQDAQAANFSANRINHELIEQDDQTTRQPEKEVNLCVKVPEPLRRHWAAEAKRAGITMTEIMVEALTARFGKPEDHKTR